MTPSTRRPPPWWKVWIQARAAHTDPVAALVAAGIVDAEELARKDPAIRRPARASPELLNLGDDDQDDDAARN